METNNNNILQKGLKANTGIVPQPGNIRKANDVQNAAQTLPQLSPALLLRFKITEKLGSGSFGVIYKAFDKHLSEYVALKFENHPNKTNESGSALTLGREAKILAEIGGVPGMPTAYYFVGEENYSLLELKLLGPNLEQLFKLCNRKFSTQTTFLLAEQMLKRIEYVHSRRYLHRDIKPENFVIGNPAQDPRTLYLIDFGLSKMYRDPITGKHVGYKENKGLVGTARYASISTHLGIEQSRRDDLESIGYLLIYFIKGSLPWQNIRAQNKTEKYKLIADSKVSTSIEELCKGIPREFVLYMNYVRNLNFTESPDYKYLKRLFRKQLTENEWTVEEDFDWNLNFGKFQAMSLRNIDSMRNQTREGVIDDFKTELEHGAIAHKSNLRVNMTPANFYSKRRTSTLKAEDSILANLSPKNESKGFGPYLQDKINNIHIIKKSNVEPRQSVTARHSNGTEVPNVESKFDRNPIFPLADQRANENNKNSRMPVPKIDLSSNKFREINRVKSDFRYPQIDGNAAHFDSFIGIILSPDYRSSRNMMPEKPEFTLCSVAKGESEESVNLSSNEGLIKDTKFLKPMIAKQKEEMSLGLKDIRQIKTLQAKRQEDYDEDIHERKNSEIAVYHYPKILSVKRLEEIKSPRKGVNYQNRATISTFLGNARTMRDCRDIVLFRTSMVSTRTEIHKASLLGDA